MKSKPMIYQTAFDLGNFQPFFKTRFFGICLELGNFKKIIFPKSGFGNSLNPDASFWLAGWLAGWLLAAGCWLGGWVGGWLLAAGWLANMIRATANQQ